MPSWRTNTSAMEGVGTVPGSAMYGNHFGCGEGFPGASLEEAGDVGVASDPEYFDLLPVAFDLLT